VRRALHAFGQFWWEFLIGDTPEFLLATGVVVALAFLLRGERAALVVTLPLVTLAAVAGSAAWSRRR
jgi:hypothetical protein